MVRFVEEDVAAAGIMQPPLCLGPAPTLFCLSKCFNSVLIRCLPPSSFSLGMNEWMNLIEGSQVQCSACKRLLKDALALHFFAKSSPEIQVLYWQIYLHLCITQNGNVGTFLLSTNALFISVKWPYCAALHLDHQVFFLTRTGSNNSSVAIAMLQIKIIIYARWAGAVSEVKQWRREDKYIWQFGQIQQSNGGAGCQEEGWGGFAL